MCVSSDNSFVGVGQKPISGPWKGSFILKQKLCVDDLEAFMSTPKETLSSLALGLRLLKPKPSILFWGGQTHKVHWIASLAGYLLKWGQFLEMESWSWNGGTIGDSRKREYWAPKSLMDLLCQEQSPPSAEGVHSGLLEEATMTFCVTIVLQNTVSSPQNPSPPSLFAFRPTF